MLRVVNFITHTHTYKLKFYFIYKRKLKMAAKKILVFGLPFHGHLNPLAPLLQKLSSEINVKIIFYSASAWKDKIESLGSNFEFRACISNDLVLDLEHEAGSGVNKAQSLCGMLKFQLDVADDQMIYIVKEIDQEKPDLIVYDCTAVYFRWASKYYKKCFRNVSTPITVVNPLPPVVGFCPAFKMDEGIYPNSYEKSLLIKFDFNLLRSISALTYHQVLNL